MTKVQKVQHVTTVSTADELYELPNTGPKVLLEAALAACALKTTKEVLERDGIEYDEADLYAEATATLTKAPARFNEFSVSIVLPSLPESYDQEKMMISIERGCIIGNTLKHQGSVSFHKES